MKADELLFRIIREELTSARTEETAAAMSQDGVIAAVYELAKHHDMAHLVASYAEAAAIPAEGGLKDEMQRVHMTQIYRHHRLLAEQERVCALLEEAEIDFLPLKGAVIRELYPESWQRPSCDVDILVKEDDVRRAKELIVERLGYTADEKDNYHDISMHSKGGVHLELHFNILEHKDCIDGLLGRVWDYASTVEEGRHRHRLTNEFLTFHNIAHSYYHFVSGGCGIKPFMDLYVMKELSPFTVDESVLRGMLKECGIERFYDCSSALSHAWFGGGDGEGVPESFGKYVLEGGVYGTLQNRVTVKRAEKGGRLSYLLSRIFMPYESLKYRYPVLKKHKILYPFCQVARWFSALSPKRRKKIKMEMRSNSSLGGERIDEVCRLMSELGIEQ